MKPPLHIAFILLFSLLCIPASGEEKVTLRPIQPSISKTIPYSAGVFIHGGKLSNTYKTSSGYINLNGFEVGGGCFARLYFHRHKTTNPLCHAQVETGYRYHRFYDMDNLQEKMTNIDCHYISPAVTLGADIESLLGLKLGFGCDFLTGFRGTQHGIAYSSISRECMNKVIPKVILGFNMFDSILSLNFEFPLNSGPINLNRYTYYNRQNISIYLPFRFSARIQIRTFGSSHR